MRLRIFSRIVTFELMSTKNTIEYSVWQLNLLWFSKAYFLQECSKYLRNYFLNRAWVQQAFSKIQFIWNADARSCCFILMKIFKCRSIFLRLRWKVVDRVNGFLIECDEFESSIKYFDFWRYYLIGVSYIEESRFFWRTELKCNWSGNPIVADDSVTCDGNHSLGGVIFAAVFVFEWILQRDYGGGSLIDDFFKDSIRSIFEKLACVVFIIEFPGGSNNVIIDFWFIIIFICGWGLVGDRFVSGVHLRRTSTTTLKRDTFKIWLFCYRM